jgi:hypothetical protein
MTPEQRFERLERVVTMFAVAGRKAQNEWRKQSREQAEKINILIQMQMETTEQIKGLAVAQAELTKSQDRTDRALRAFINRLRKSRNGDKPKH